MTRVLRASPHEHLLAVRLGAGMILVRPIELVEQFFYYHGVRPFPGFDFTQLITGTMIQR